MTIFWSKNKKSRGIRSENIVLFAEPPTRLETILKMIKILRDGILKFDLGFELCAFENFYDFASTADRPIFGQKLLYLINDKINISNMFPTRNFT